MDFVVTTSSGLIANEICILTSAVWLKTIFFPVKGTTYVQNRTLAVNTGAVGLGNRLPGFPVKTGESLAINLSSIKTVHSLGSPTAGTRQA